MSDNQNLISNNHICYSCLTQLKENLIKNVDLFDNTNIEEIIKCLSRAQLTAQRSEFSNQQCSYIISNVKFLNSQILNNEKNNLNPGMREYIKTILSNIYSKLCDYLYLYNSINNVSTGDIVNSLDYYKKQVIDIEAEKKELLNTIKELENQKSKETDKKENLLKEKEEELNKYVQQIELLNKKIKQSEALNDAKAEWNNKIIGAFTKLKDYIQPIKDEHTRLRKLYWGYLSLSILLVIALFIIEGILCCKIWCASSLPTWEQYISSILPIPISLGLLWGFITQMNRAQRQMVILAKQIYEIEYTEGLLLTLNTLSVDINESMRKVNEAIDKLIDNHLKYDCEPLKNEESLKCETKKDAMPYETIEKVVKSIMEGYKATK